MEVKAKVVKTFPTESKVKAVVSLMIDGCFVVRGIKIIESAKGLFVVMPNEKFKDEYRNICHPTTKESRETIIEAVMNAYEQNQSQAQSSFQPEQ
jgi:stage V sporulation protein G